MSDDTPTALLEEPVTPEVAPNDTSAEATELSPEQLKAALAAARKEAAGYRVKAKELEPLAAKARELEDASKSDLEKLTEREALAAKRADSAEGELMRLRAALAAGLDVELADRLRGSTAEELAEDAKALADRFGSKAPDAPPSPGRKPRAALTDQAAVSADTPDTANDPSSIAAKAMRLSGFSF